jgi:hypothetical protein
MAMEFDEEGCFAPNLYEKHPFKNEKSTEKDVSKKASADVLVIFVCGFGVDNCKNGKYDGERIFGDIVKWAVDNGYKTEFFETVDKKTTADAIVKLIQEKTKENPDLWIHIVGHSAGADAAVEAVITLVEDGKGGNIKGVALLDSYLNVNGDISKGFNDLHDKNKSLFWGGRSTADDLDFGNLTPVNYGVSHTTLAVDQGAQMDIISFFTSR